MGRYTLIPYQTYTPQFEVLADFSIREETLFLSYTVTAKEGDPHLLAWPPWQNDAGRIDELWQTTCFEFFVSGGPPVYYEGNFSPSGAWNIYRFVNYREKMQRPKIEESVYPKRSVISPFGLHIEVPLSLFVKNNPSIKWKWGLATILLVGGKKQYFALKHTAKEPDFHRGESFIIEC